MTIKDQIIGLTGSIGSGKSRVAELFTAHGALVIAADQIARSILEPGEKGWKALQKIFGGRFFKDDQTIDRQKLRSAIFTDPELRGVVDSLLHPLIREEIVNICRKDNDANCRLTIVEVPLLYEAGWQEDFDLVVVVAADDETCRKRIMIRDGVSHPEAEQALAAQMRIDEKTVMANHVIDNSGAWDDTVRQVEELIKKLTVNPANILGIEAGTLSEDAAADITIIDPECEKVINPNQFLSKGKRTPFAEMKLQGKIETVLVSGEVRYESEK